MSHQSKNIDDFLIEKIKKDDWEALNQLFSRYYQTLCKYVFSITGPGYDHELAVADVFVHLWEKRKDLRIRNPRAYLFKISRNNIYGIIRKKPKHLSWEEIQLPEPASETENIRDNQHQVEQAKYILAKMPAKCRQIFLLHRVHHFKYAEIAEILAISPRTVENHMAKALKTIHLYHRQGLKLSGRNN